MCKKVCAVSEIFVPYANSSHCPTAPPQCCVVAQWQHVPCQGCSICATPSSLRSRLDQCPALAPLFLQCVHLQLWYWEQNLCNMWDPESSSPVVSHGHFFKVNDLKCRKCLAWHNSVVGTPTAIYSHQTSNTAVSKASNITMGDLDILFSVTDPEQLRSCTQHHHVVAVAAAAIIASVMEHRLLTLT